MQKHKKYIPAILFFTPFFALAIGKDIFYVIGLVEDILTWLVPLLIGVAVVVFLWGVVKYITAGGDEEKIKKGRDTMIWGIVGLFVMVAVWGLVWILLNTFNLDTGTPPYPAL